MTLTPREYEVARLFALGRTWDQVEYELGIARRTLRAHRSHAFGKAGGETMADVWRAEGWLRVPPDRHLVAIEREIEQIVARLAELTAEAERLRDDMRAPDSTPGVESPVAAVTPAPSLRRVG